MPSNTSNFPPVQEGSPLSAVTGASYHNALRQGLKWIELQRNASGAGKAKPKSTDYCVVWVQNNSEETVDRGGVLCIDGDPPVTPADNLADFLLNSVLSGKTPSTDRTGLFCVMLEPVIAGAIGQGVMAGVVPVLVHLDEAGDPKRLDIKDGENGYLVSADNGIAEVLWCDTPNSYPGEAWGLVRIGSSSPTVRFFRGTTTAAVASTDSTYTVSGLVARDGGSVPDPDAGSDWTVQNGAEYGAGHTLDEGVTIRIEGELDENGDMVLVAVDPPCPAAGVNNMPQASLW